MSRISISRTLFMAHKLTRLVPVFAVDDIERLCTFYEKSLGFVQDFRYGEPTYYVGLVKDVVEIHLISTSSPNARQPSGSGYLSLLVDQVDDLYRRLKGFDAEIVVLPDDRDYGLRDFMIKDPEGNVLTLGEPIVK